MNVSNHASLQSETSDPVLRQPRRSILVICPFPQGVAAGQRLKYEQYFGNWRENGYDLTVTSFMDMRLWSIVYKKGHYVAKILGGLRGQVRRISDLFRIAHFDVVYVFMWVTPMGTPLFEYLTRKLARKLVFDVEDNVLVGQNMPAEQNPNWIVSLLKGPDKAAYLIRNADHVITSSPFLNDTCMARNRSRRCTYITSSVDTDRYVVHARRDPSAPVTVGWTGTFSSRPFLDLLTVALQRLAKRRRFRLVVIGNFEYHLEGVDTSVIQWTKEREIEDLQTIDIGLYPLPIDDWVLGKSGLKAIQYMAMGIPTVATRVGTTPLVLEDGVTGLLVETEDDWIAALERLIDDPDLREAMGRKARCRTEERYSVRRVSERYLTVLDEMVGSPPGCDRSDSDFVQRQQVGR